MVPEAKPVADLRGFPRPSDDGVVRERWGNFVFGVVGEFGAVESVELKCVVTKEGAAEFNCTVLDL